jgi:hypothetical protein
MPTTVPSSLTTSATVKPSRTSTPAATAASTRILSSTVRRGAYAVVRPSAARAVPRIVTGPKSNAYVSIAGHPLAITASSTPHRRSAATPGEWIRWDDMVSLGKVALSTITTRRPALASNIAVGAPAQRAPTTMTS